jgi:hypothetical protein
MARRDSRTGLVLGLGVMTTGLVAGLFYSFACAVLPGLANAWNIVRTLAVVASLGCMCRALVVHARS